MPIQEWPYRKKKVFNWSKKWNQRIDVTCKDTSSQKLASQIDCPQIPDQCCYGKVTSRSRSRTLPVSEERQEDAIPSNLAKVWLQCDDLSSYNLPATSVVQLPVWSRRPTSVVQKSYQCGPDVLPVWSRSPTSAQTSYPPRAAQKSPKWLKQNQNVAYFQKLWTFL
jgi:hypothetical protein